MLTSFDIEIGKRDQICFYYVAQNYNLNFFSYFLEKISHIGVYLGSICKSKSR